MKIKFKPRWWTIPPISTKRTITAHLYSLNIKSHNTVNIWRWKFRSWLWTGTKIDRVKVFILKNHFRATLEYKNCILYFSLFVSASLVQNISRLYVSDANLNKIWRFYCGYTWVKKWTTHIKWSFYRPFHSKGRNWLMNV